MVAPIRRIEITSIGRWSSGLLIAGALATPVAAGTVQFAHEVFVAREWSERFIGVVRTGDTTGPAAVVVDVDPASGTAVRGIDFEVDLPTGVLNFADGESFRLIRVESLRDDLTEGTEYARLVLSSPIGADVGAQSALRLLVLDDFTVTNTAESTFDLSTATGTRIAGTEYGYVAEGDTVTIDVSHTPADDAGTVDVTVIGGSATLGVDYVEPATTLTFAAGTDTVGFTLSTIADSVSEGFESIEIFLANPTPAGALANTQRAVLLVEDDDAAPAGRFRLEHPSIISTTDRLGTPENEPLTFRVTRLGGTSGVATVDYIALDESVSQFARRYVPTLGTLVFGDGVQEQTFSVPLINDQTHTSTVAFRVALVNATNGAAVDPGAGSVIVTVRDDDPVVASGSGCFPGDIGCALANSDCFIATAAYGSYLDPHVAALREFRDRHLLTNAPGRAFVGWYYGVSPPFAALIRRHKVLRIATRAALTPVVFAIVHPLSLLMLLSSCGAICLWARFRCRREIALLRVADPGGG